MNEKELSRKLYYYLSYVRKIVDVIAVVLMLIQDSLFGGSNKKKVRRMKKK